MLCQGHKLEVKDVFRCRGLFSDDIFEPEVGVIINVGNGSLVAVECRRIDESVSLDNGKGNVSLLYSNDVFVRFADGGVYALANRERPFSEKMIKRCKFESFSKSGWKQIDDRDLDRILHWNDSGHGGKEFKHEDRLQRMKDVLGDYDSDDKSDDYDMDFT